MTAYLSFTVEVQGGRCVSASLLLQIPEENNFKGALFGLAFFRPCWCFVYGPEARVSVIVMGAMWKSFPLGGHEAERDKERRIGKDRRRERGREGSRQMGQGEEAKNKM